MNEEIINQVINVCCQVGEADRNEVFSKDKKRNVTIVRGMVFKILHDELGMSTVSCAEISAQNNGPEDRTSIANSLNKMATWLTDNKYDTVFYYKKALSILTEKGILAAKIIVHLPKDCSVHKVIREISKNYPTVQFEVI